jgi:hypothetical protein
LSADVLLGEALALSFTDYHPNRTELLSEGKSAVSRGIRCKQAHWAMDWKGQKTMSVRKLSSLRARVRLLLLSLPLGSLFLFSGCAVGYDGELGDSEGELADSFDEDVGTVEQEARTHTFYYSKTVQPFGSGDWSQDRYDEGRRAHAQMDIRLDFSKIHLSMRTDRGHLYTFPSGDDLSVLRYRCRKTDEYGAFTAKSMTVGTTEYSGDLRSVTQEFQTPCKSGVAYAEVYAVIAWGIKW